MLLIKLTSTHRVGQKTYFPERILLSGGNIVKGRHFSWSSKRDKVPISLWHCIKSRSMWHTICLNCKYRSDTIKVRSSGDETMATKREHYVTIEGSANKRSITGTFAISLDRNFLPVRLIRDGKITRSLQWFEFLKDFSLSTNLKHFSNTNEWRKFLKEVIKPYVIKQRQILKCSADQKAPIIMGVFNGQMTTAVIDAIKEANTCIVNVPANMTRFYQPLHLMANDYCKRFLKWYSGQLKTQLDNGVETDDSWSNSNLFTLVGLWNSKITWACQKGNRLLIVDGKELVFLMP